MQITTAEQDNESEILEFQEKLRIASLEKSKLAEMSEAEILADALHKEECHDEYCNWGQGTREGDTCGYSDHRIRFLDAAEELLSIGNTATILGILSITRFL